MLKQPTAPLTHDLGHEESGSHEANELPAWGQRTVLFDPIILNENLEEAHNRGKSVANIHHCLSFKLPPLQKPILRIPGDLFHVLQSHHPFFR